METALLTRNDVAAKRRQGFSSLVELLRWRVERQAHKELYTFLSEALQLQSRLTYADLDSRAQAIGGWLQDVGATGQRVLLLFPPGLEYVAAFFGCLYATAVAVPAYPPRPNRNLERLRTII